MKRYFIFIGYSLVIIRCDLISNRQELDNMIRFGYDVMRLCMIFLINFGLTVNFSLLVDYVEYIFRRRRSECIICRL